MHRRPALKSRADAGDFRVPPALLVDDGGFSNSSKTYLVGYQFERPMPSFLFKLLYF